MNRGTRTLILLVLGLILAFSMTAVFGVAVLRGGTNNCHPAWKCQGPRPTNGSSPSPTGTPNATVAPSPSAAPTASGLLFDDEFTGTTLSSAWGHNYHCCMNGGLLDPGLSTVSGGYLHLDVVNRAGTWYGTIIDTKNSFVHTYGLYEARIGVPVGTGLWPAFWEYLDGYDEIDTTEICANPVGQNGGNDVSGLHTTVHYGTGQQIGTTHHYGNLSLAWHVFGLDWRPDHIAFYLDGALVWSESSVLISTPKAMLLDLGLGGSWCGSPTSATPLSSQMLVDWVHVSP